MATTLVLGAARNGKSAYAASLMAVHSEVTYLATGPMQEDAPDRIWADRVAELRANRPENWQTTVTMELSKALMFSRKPVLIDTLAHWVWRTIDRHDTWRSTKRAIATLEPELDELLVIYRTLPHDVVAISDEVGWGGEATSGKESTYRDVLSHVNNRFSAASDHVHLLIGGRVLDLSDVPPAFSGNTASALLRR